MDNSFLKLFINEIEDTGLSLYYEDEQDSILNEEIVLEIEGNTIKYIKIDKYLSYMDVYLSLQYYDAKKSERLDGSCIEEIERDHLLYMFQKNFEKERILQYTIEAWDDEYSYLCPYPDIYVGLHNVPCDVEIIKSFVEKTDLFCNYIKKFSLEELQQKECEKLLKQNGCGAFEIIRNKTIDYVPNSENNVLEWHGKEYVLFKFSDQKACIEKIKYDAYLAFLDNVELYSDYSLEICKNTICIKSCSFTAYLPTVEYDNAIDIETIYFKSKILSFLQFNGSESLGMFFETYHEKTIDSYSLPTLFTEGHTDWRHIKNAFTYGDIKYNEQFRFEEYTSTAKIGDKKLLDMCSAFSNETSPFIKIMIFDRDGSVKIKDVEDETTGFKDWGNHVYSFAIPIPEHRKETDAISIEHYYTDQEITKEYEISGINRRLYLGNEFDHLGRAPHISRFCRKTSFCGEDHINIIDDQVIDPNSDLDIDYALSKMAFAEKICSEKLSKEAMAAFHLLYAKILKVIEYDKSKK